MKKLFEDAQLLTEGSSRRLVKDLLDLKSTLNNMTNQDWEKLSRFLGANAGATYDILDDKTLAVDNFLRGGEWLK
jgi:hypothetical protein